MSNDCIECGHEERFFDGEQCNFIIDVLTDRACGHKCSTFPASVVTVDSETVLRQVEAAAVAGIELPPSVLLGLKSIAKHIASGGEREEIERRATCALIESVRTRESAASAPTPREQWLLADVSSIGRMKIDVHQYDELRALARRLADMRLTPTTGRATTPERVAGDAVTRAIDAMRTTQRLFNLPSGHILMTACVELEKLADAPDKGEVARRAAEKFVCSVDAANPIRHLLMRDMNTAEVAAVALIIEGELKGEK